MSKIKEKTDKVPFSSNNIRLSGYEWLIVGIICSVLFFLVPVLWERLEHFDPEADYRLPSELSNDYWLFKNYCRQVCSRYESLLIGDSVIQGSHVSKEETLSHYLNEIAGRDRFANMGVDGAHPVALAGLLKYYGRDISDKNVILYLNTLWMSSKKLDLNTEKEFHFYHPRLAPQFLPNIPCYKDSYSNKISAVVERYMPFFNFSTHLRIAYFDNMNMPTWTIEHPYENPLRTVMLELRASEKNQKELVPRKQNSEIKEDFQWVEPGMSLQWRFFRQAIELLKARNNTVFVLVGPFNEHIMEDESRTVYQKMKSEIELWLRQKNIAYYAPPTLPSDFYYDASHPSSQGYAILAKQLFENRSFKSSILKVEP
jgi:hypothetical protein